MSPSTGLKGIGLDGLQQAIREEPALTLRFFSFGITLRKKTETGMTEYPVSAEDVATALAAKMAFNTGILPLDSLCVLVEGTQRRVASYRRPQKSAIWLEGTEDPLRIPLPGLVMIRKTTANRSPDYQVWAVTERPANYDAKLYHAPLPNIYSQGGVCWGSVKRVHDAALAGPALDEDWAQLLGSKFGNHTVSGKSKLHRGDVRKMFLKLEQRRARVYPKNDLVEARRTLGGALGVGAS